MTRSWVKKTDLRTDFGAALRERIVYLANETLTGELELGDHNKGWGIGPGQQRSTSYLLDAIDRGNRPGGRTGREVFHTILTSPFISHTANRTIDPVNGTKGFLRGAQYAVYLALIVDAQVKVGVIGCPNLLLTLANPEKRGCIFVTSLVR